MHYRVKKQKHPSGWSRIAAGNLIVVKREWWNALPPTQVEPFTEPLNYIIFTYTRGENCYNKKECKQTIQDLQKKQMEDGLPDIQYNFLIGGDENVYEGRGWKNKPLQNDKYPDLYGTSIEVAYVGDFPTDALRHPTANMWDKGWQIVCFALNNNIMENVELRFHWVFGGPETLVDPYYPYLD